MKKEDKFKLVRYGSALIMTIVLTVLLAAVGVMFVAVARMDRASTSNIADNKSLDLAAKSIIEIINKELVFDTPGVAKKAGLSQLTYPQYYDYKDYPDVNDAWLASVEPHIRSGKMPGDSNEGAYLWRKISDVTGYINTEYGPDADVNVPVRPSSSQVIREYPDVNLNTDGSLEEQLADADGDGIADSKWIELKDIRSSKARPIYAAIRVIDNGAMLNVNTAHTFNPDSNEPNRIDGSSQMQINLKGLLRGADDINELHNARSGSGATNWESYRFNVLWNYREVDSNYTAFDVSDELELRYRYCIDSKFVSRFEANLPNTADAYGAPGGLYDTIGNWDLDEWEKRITEPDNADADRRHLLTTYNYDRIIDPNGDKMTNLNDADVNSLFGSVRSALLDAKNNFPEVNAVAAQIAVNIFDYRDSNSTVTVFNVNDVNYYGFERPCIYISELACREVNISGTVHKSYAVELYKPYLGDEDPVGWKLGFMSTNGDLEDVTWSGLKQYHVITWGDTTDAPFVVDGNNADTQDGGTGSFEEAGDMIFLTRTVGIEEVIVDSITIASAWPVADGNYSIQRDITKHKCIRRIWDSNNARLPTLGKINDYNTTITNSNIIQAHPADNDFNNVGQIGMVFRKAAYMTIANPIGPNDTAASVLVNLADPNYQKIFKYLTVMDPTADGIDNDGDSVTDEPDELKIKGRININTAPSYVIAQLPWVSHRIGYDSNALADNIIAYRDSDANGFGSTGELMNVPGINYYALDSNDLKVFPDLDPNDGAKDDFEERDLIFARISDLVTVRSDVFTAYILVRIGVDGPQKRYMAILDRSDVKQPITDPKNRVKIKAFQFVPEAR